MNPEIIKSFETNGVLDFAKLPEKAVHALMIREWLLCLRQNTAFGVYCLARRECDDRICDAVEKVLPQIKELYEDWGDIHSMPSIFDENERNAFTDWYESKQHLFGWPEATIVDPIDWIADPGDTTLVAIANGFTREQLMRALTDFVSHHPDVLGNGPKYEPGSIKGQRMSDTLKLVIRARTVYLTETRIPQKLDFNGRRSNLTLKHLLGSRLNRLIGFNWFINGKVNQDLFEQDKLPADDLKSYTRTLKNLNKFYIACIEGTISGTFPATKNA
jgi:hypothetical protein